MFTFVVAVYKFNY